MTEMELYAAHMASIRLGQDRIFLKLSHDIQYKSGWLIQAVQKKYDDDLK